MRRSVACFATLLVLFPAGAIAQTVAAGASHTVVVKPDGTVWTWGANASGQLGDGTLIGKTTPTSVDSLSGVTAVAAGANHTLALKSDGTVWAWGANANGQLGDGTTTDRSSPVLVAGLVTVTAIAAGGRHSFAIKADGSVWAWGANESGQLGDGGTSQWTVPIPITALAPVLTLTVIALDGGDAHSVAVKNDGTVWTWGANANGQLGDGTTTPRSTPGQVAGLATATAVAAGSSHTLARLSDGSLRAWGANASGQIGDGTTTQRLSPVTVSGLSSVSAVSAGEGHSVAVKSDGTFWSWGANGSGQLGDGTATDRTTPTEVSGLTSISLGAAGHNHTIAITSTGIVWAWGANASGQVGDGTTIQRTSPAQISDANYVWKVGTPGFSVAAGTYFAEQSVVVTCATPGASIHYTTNGTDPTESDPTVLSGGTVTVDRTLTLKARAFKTGSAASNVASAIYTLKVPTPTVSPGGGLYTTAQTVTLACAASSCTIRYTTDGADPTDTSTAYSAPLSISTFTTLKFRGFRTNWQTSDAATETYTFNYGTLAAPTASPAAGTYISSVDVTLSAASFATIRYTTDGSDPTVSSTVYTGALPFSVTTTLKARAFHVDWTASATTTAVYTIQVATPAFSLAAGLYAAGQRVTITCATSGATIHYTTNGVEPTETDLVVASGGSVPLENGTLKAKAWKASTAPSQTGSAAYTLAEISAGANHSLVLTPTGVVWAWGANGNGQLGDGTTTQRVIPTQVSALSEVKRIDAGQNHSVAAKNDGTVWSWGANSSGQLGDGTTTQRLSPVQVSGLINVIAVAAGDSHTVALKTDGTVWAWGENSSGQLGDGTTTRRLTPVQVLNLSNVVAIGAGAFHSLALKNDGTLWAWGNNGNGQLGDGTTTPRTSPVQVSGLTSVIWFAGGESHSLAVKSDGTAWAWGSNVYRQLGDGTGTQRTTPVAVVGLSSAKVIAAGPTHSLAAKQDGTAWAWGWNASGQLGDGTTTFHDTAVQVSTLVGTTALAAGLNHSLAFASDGTVWAWGGNSSGQLGDGTTTGRLTPVRISDANFAWLVATPQFSVPAGTYTSVQTVTVTCATPGATIHYTTNGADPTESDPVVASGGTVQITESTTLKARAWKTGMPPSNINTAVYTLKVPNPTVSPGSGTYFTPQTVTISNTVSGVTLRYTTDGTDPTESSQAIASGGTLTVDTSLTLKVRGWKTNWTTSDVTTATYVLKVGTATLSPGGGSYTSTQNVTVSTVTPGATLYYTLSGQEPTQADLTVASGSTVLVDRSATLKVKGWRVGWTTSDTASATYLLTLGTVATPVFSPAPGTFTSAQTVSISTSTSGATIRLTRDGTEPTLRSPVYSAPLIVDADTTLKAKAFKADWTASATATGDYVIDLGTVAVPTVNPGAGTYVTTQSVVVSCATAGATIRYTTNGVDPTENDSSVASGASIVVDRSLRLKLKAFKSGVTPSAIRVVDYWITGTVAAGTSHTLALKADGTVWAWGFNLTGQLGDGSTTQRTSPIQVSVLTDVVAIAGGGSHSLAVKRDGTAWAWGDNGSGQLGDGTFTRRLTPVQVSTLTDVVAVAAGDSHSLAIKRDGSVWAWGLNNSGQVGDGSQTSRNVPVQVMAAGAVLVAGGVNHSLALKTDGGLSGTVWTWGHNGNGQLGEGSTALLRTTPAAVLTTAIAIGAGDLHSLAVMADGSGRAWGSNGQGRLGDGTETQRLGPVVIVDLSSAATIEAGMQHSVSLATNGSVWAWGDGAKVGMYDMSSSNVLEQPQRVPAAGDQNVAVAAGGNHTVTARRDGTVWTWGTNSNGQLTTARILPIQVPGFSLVGGTWPSSDADNDGLPNWREIELGTDPLNPDTNGDGIRDGAAVASGLSPTNVDMDGDGLTNASELASGTDPFRADTDGDGVLDAADAFPLDPSRWQLPPPTPGDTTPPVITLQYPTNAVLLPP